MVTELGGTRYEHIHVHGIMTITEEQERDLAEIWSYGYVFIGDRCNGNTAGYITKFIVTGKQIGRASCRERV